MTLISRIPSYQHILDLDDRLPPPHLLIPHLKQEYQSHLYVQLAVCHESFAHAVLYVAQDWLTRTNPMEQSLALHYIRALGARYQASAIYQSLIAQDLKGLQQDNPLWIQQKSAPHLRLTSPQISNSIFPTAVYYYCYPIIADTYLATLCDLLPESHPIRIQAIDYCVSHQISLELIWRVWPKNRSYIPLFKWSQFLFLQSNQALIQEVAIRIVLMHTDDVLAFCTYLANNPQSEIYQKELILTIHKQCKRIGKINLWRQVRSILKTR